MDQNDLRTVTIQKYSEKLNLLNENCIVIESEKEFIELFKGVIIMFIKNINALYNKILIKLPELKFSASSEKITNLNILLESLEGSGKLFGIDCIDIILRAYINYFYVKFRDDIMAWDIEKIKYIEEKDIHDIVIDSANKEQAVDTVTGYLDIIPEVIIMVNNLSEKEVLKLTYLLNNINVIIDIYLAKKSQNQLKP